MISLTRYALTHAVWELEHIK